MVASQGSLELLPSGSYRFSVYAGVDPLTGAERRERKTVKGPLTEKQAKKKLAEFVQLIDDGITGGKEHTFGALAARCLASKEYTPAGRRTTEDFLNWYVLPYLKNIPVEDIDVDLLEAHYGRLRRKGGKKGGALAASTVVRAHGIIRSMLTDAKRWKWVRDNVAEDARTPTIEARDSTEPTPEVARALVAFAWAKDPALGLYLRLSAIVGGRPQELCALRWSRIDLDAGSMTLERRIVVGRDEAGRETWHELKGTKGRGAQVKKGRTIALHADTVELLRGHHQAMAERALTYGDNPLAADAFVFSYDPECRVGWRPHTISNRYRLWVRGAYIKQQERLHAEDPTVPLAPPEVATVRLYDLRHFAATYMVEGGVKIPTAAERLGQSASTMMKHYTHGLDTSDRAAAALLHELTNEPAPA